MCAELFLLPLLLLSSAGRPKPTPTPAATPTPAMTTRRTLADVARERKLKRDSEAKPTPAGDIIENGYATGPLLGLGDVHPDLKAEVLSGPPNAVGEVVLSGMVRNYGAGPACNVRVTLRVYSLAGKLLGQQEVGTSIATIAANRQGNFRGVVKVAVGGMTVGKTEAVVASFDEKCK